MAERVAATGRLLTLARAYFMIHRHAVAYDKQSIRAQIIFAAENPRLSSLSRRRSNLTARYLATDYRKLARRYSYRKKGKKSPRAKHDNAASCDNFELAFAKSDKSFVRVELHFNRNFIAQFRVLMSTQAFAYRNYPVYIAPFAGRGVII